MSEKPICIVPGTQTIAVASKDDARRVVSRFVSRGFFVQYVKRHDKHCVSFSVGVNLNGTSRDAKLFAGVNFELLEVGE